MLLHVDHQANGYYLKFSLYSYICHDLIFLEVHLVSQELRVFQVWQAKRVYQVFQVPKVNVLSVNQVKST